MDDVLFGKLIAMLKDGSGLIRSRQAAARSLYARAARQRLALEALRRLRHGPTARPTDRRKNVFFVRRASEAPRAFGARYSAFWPGAMLKGDKARDRAKSLDAAGSMRECVESRCPHCSEQVPVIGMDPPLAADADGVVITCRLFTLCGDCMRLAQLADAALRSDIEASLDGTAVARAAPRRAEAAN